MVEHALLRAARAHFAGGKLSLPEGAGLIWEMFAALHETRGAGFNGPEPIRFAEIQAYAVLMRWPLEARHVSLIRALDRAWLEHRAEGDVPGANAAPAQPVNPAAFDAVFGGGI
jgi:hypothetical protein